MECMISTPRKRERGWKHGWKGAGNGLRGDFMLGGERDPGSGGKEEQQSDQSGETLSGGTEA